MKQGVLIAASLGLAVLLLGALVIVAEIDTDILIAALSRVGWGNFLLIALSTTCILLLSAVKWKIVAERFWPESAHRPGGLFPYFFYTSLGTAVGQFLPLHASTIAVRGVGMRLNNRTPIMQSMVSSFVEQIFDVLVPLAFAVPALLMVLGHIGLPAFWASSVTLLAVCGPLVIVLLPRLLRVTDGPTSGSGRLARRVAWLRERCGPYVRKADARLLWQLYALSLIRFAVVAAATVFIAWAGEFDIAPASILVGLPLVMLSNLLVLTPAGAGIVEWTWSGLLFGLGVGFAAATEFALASRLLGIGTMLLLTVVLYLLRPLISVTRGLIRGTPAV